MTGLVDWYPGPSGVICGLDEPPDSEVEGGRIVELPEWMVQ